MALFSITTAIVRDERPFVRSKRFHFPIYAASFVEAITQLSLDIKPKPELSTNFLTGSRKPHFWVAS